METPVEWDVFISHASEDKEEFVRPLAESLRERGLRVWYDEFTLTVGDSLRRSIDRGLAQSRFGVVVISQNFLKKEWPQKELDGLAAREIDGVKVILPVWHKITAEQIRAYSPMLMDRLSATSEKGLDYVTDQLMQAVRQGRRTTSGGQVSHSRVSLAEPSSKIVPTAAMSVENLQKYASAFHETRVERIMKKPPIAILDGASLIMHVVPVDAINERPSEAFEDMSRNPHLFAPMGTTHARDVRINYDGLLTGSNAEGLTKPQRSYVHVFRSGAVEAVETSLALGAEHIYIPLPQLQATLIKYARLYAMSLNRFGVSVPYAIAVSLGKAEGMRLLQDFIGTALPFDLPGTDLDRDLFRFGCAIFETIPVDYNEAAKMLKPILMHLTNAAGLHSPPYFDSEGNYQLIANL